jgi:tRNA-dihydrouridine synthase
MSFFNYYTKRVTNSPLRLLCKKYGASLVYSEMISSEAVVRENHNSIAPGLIAPQERPVGIQLMGSEWGCGY